MVDRPRRTGHTCFANQNVNSVEMCEGLQNQVFNVASATKIAGNSYRLNTSFPKLGFGLGAIRQALARYDESGASLAKQLGNGSSNPASCARYDRRLAGKIKQGMEHQLPFRALVTRSPGGQADTTPDDANLHLFAHRGINIDRFLSMLAHNRRDSRRAAGHCVRWTVSIFINRRRHYGCLSQRASSRSPC